MRHEYAIDDAGPTHPKGYAHLRTDTFAPYLDGEGPTFTLDTWDTNRPHGRGPQWGVAYRLTMRDSTSDTLDSAGNPVSRETETVLFEAEDYGCAPGDAIDSDRCVAALMGFLTLRPGDTDEEYFDDYTDAQLAYTEHHAETLACEVEATFGEETCS